MTRILWDPNDPYYGAVMEPEARHESTFRTLAALNSAVTVGELRAVDLAPWGASLLDVFLDRYEDEHDEPVGADTPWEADEVMDMLMDAVPVPWDYQDVLTWLDPAVMAPYVSIGGASPGGNIDVVEVKDVDGLRAALESVGYELVPHPGLTDEYYSAL